MYSNFMMQGHVPNHNSQPVSCKRNRKQKKQNPVTVQLLHIRIPRSILKPHCPGYTPYKLNLNSWGWELELEFPTCSKVRVRALAVCKVAWVIPICSHRCKPLIPKAFLIIHSKLLTCFCPKYYITLNYFNMHPPNIFFLSFFFFGHTVQLVGSQFPNKGLNPGHTSESAQS